MVENQNISRWRFFRSWVRHLPIIGSFAGILGDLQRHIIKTIQIHRLPKLKLYEEFQHLAPNSAGNPRQRTDLTRSTIHRLFPELNRLIDQMQKREVSPILTIEEFLEIRGYKTEDAKELMTRFTEQGSDKANPNNYYKIYSYLLSAIGSPTHILEIGLGSNNLNIVSNMGVFGRPGASIRAFRDYIPSALIYGADIDPGALFQEERIQTTWVDQTKIDTLEMMFDFFGVEFDLIIDDGLHSPDANVSTLIAALGRCKSGGYVVIEDISKSAREIWRLVEFILESKGISAQILSGTNADIFLVKAP